jgi:hypothetical protein
MKGYYIVAFCRGNFSYRFVTENSTTIYDDNPIAVVDTEEQAMATVGLLEDGYKYGYLDGIAEND